MTKIPHGKYSRTLCSSLVLEALSTLAVGCVVGSPLVRHEVLEHGAGGLDRFDC